MTDENFAINLTLSKLPGAQVSTGRSGKRAIVFYIDETDGLSEKDGAVYLNLTAIRSKNSSYGDTHFIVPTVKGKPKEYRPPIIGNVKPFPPKDNNGWKNPMDDKKVPMTGINVTPDEDLPF